MSRGEDGKFLFGALPEEIDENGIGRTLTCISFRPLPDDIVHQLSKKYQLYR